MVRVHWADVENLGFFFLLERGRLHSSDHWLTIFTAFCRLARSLSLATEQWSLKSVLSHLSGAAKKWDCYYSWPSIEHLPKDISPLYLQSGDVLHIWHTHRRDSALRLHNIVVSTWSLTVSSTGIKLPVLCVLWRTPKLVGQPLMSGVDPFGMPKRVHSQLLSGP